MLQKVFAIYDVKAEGYKPAWTMNTVGEAERSFMDACQGHDTDLGRHPEDYQLYCVGEFDQYEGALKPEKFFVCNGVQFSKLMEDPGNG